MKTAFGMIGAIFIAIATTLYNFNHKASGLACALTGILLFIILACLYIKERNSEKHSKANSQGSAGFRVSSVGTDDNTRLVIRAIGNGARGPVDFSDIINDSGLPLRAVNKALDWLFVNNFATEIKGRRGKVYTLTPEGKSTFSHLISTNRDTNPAS